MDNMERKTKFYGTIGLAAILFGLVFLIRNEPVAGILCIAGGIIFAKVSRNAKE